MGYFWRSSFAWLIDVMVEKITLMFQSSHGEGDLRPTVYVCGVESWPGSKFSQGILVV
jgi:hypothetical protein